MKERATSLQLNDQVSIHDLSNDICVLHLCGPKAPVLLNAIEPRAVTGDTTEEGKLKFMSARKINHFGGVADLEVNIFRVSFSGLQGYEMHVQQKDSLALHDLISTSEAATFNQMIHFGSVALNGLRIEQGFKIAADMNMAHYQEGGIGPFVSKKRGFVGRDDEFVAEKKCIMLEVDTEEGWEWSLPGDTPIVRKSDSKVVGYVSSSAYGIQTEKTIAIGYMYDGEDGEGLEDLYVDSYGFNWSCRVLKEPPVEMCGRID